MNGETAFVFPGQGSQKIGMLADLAVAFPVIEETFSEASSVLGYDLWDLCQNGEASAINQTEVTQPLLLTASIAIWRVWQQQGGAMPAVVSGHSLGEWSALVAAGVIEFKDAVGLVRNRGAYMQSAVPVGVGAMAAIIGLDDDKIIEACQAASNDSESVAAVNFNSPGQVVIAGHTAAVNTAMSACKDAGAKRALPLPVSAPFHTPLMKPAADRLAADIAEVKFSAPAIPVIHNVTKASETNPDVIRELVIEQITAAVPWVDCVNAIASLNVESVYECGPGKVLAGLIKRIDRNLQVVNLESVSGLEAALAK